MALTITSQQRFVVRVFGQRTTSHSVVLKMRFHSRNLMAPLCWLFLLLLAPTLSVDSTPPPKKSRTEDVGAFATRSNEGVGPAIDSSNMKEPKRSILNVTQDMSDLDDKDAANKKPCNSTTKFLQQKKSINGSWYIIDNKALERLGNNPQELVNCAQAGDKVEFALVGIQKFNRTITIFHELELVAQSSATTAGGNETENTAMFTCPDNGPFLEINATNVTVVGFNIQDCTSARDGIIVIKSKSRARFDNITIRNNKNTALSVESASHVIVENSDFNKNEVDKPGGGAIHGASYMSITIFKSVFSGNSAFHGGAIYVDNNNNLTILNTTIVDNQSEDDGGAIWMADNNSLIVRNALLLRNKAGDDGGVISLVSNNILTISDTSFSENQANENGGAMYLDDENNLSILNTTFLGNQAKYDGGAIGMEKNNMVTILTTLLSKNSASRSGGAMRLEENNNLTLTNTKLSGNQADDGGALCFLYKNLITIMSTKMTENNASYGGAMHLLTKNDLSIINSTLKGNRANYGGAMDFSTKNNLITTSTRISANHANDGGAIRLFESNNITITKSTFSRNQASRDGGAVRCVMHNVLTLSCTTLLKNIASRDGGALFLEDDNDLTFYDAQLLENNASYGGALRLSTGNKLNLSTATLSRNVARKDGGAIFSDQNNSITMFNATLSENHANVGGAIRVFKNNTITIMKTLFLWNHASIDGGAIFSEDNNNVTILSTMLSKNHAKNNGGALWLQTSSYLNFLNATLSWNEASNDGGAVWTYSNIDITIANSILHDNHATRGGAILSNEGCKTYIYHSTFERNEAKFGGCLYGDRKFLEVKGCKCHENLSSKHGGCFYLKSSNATFENSQLLLNNATNSGGGIYTFSKATLHIRNTSVASNTAEFGGGVALLNGSRLLCVSCFFETNIAKQGGGLYISSNATHCLLAQLTISLFQSNRASNFGGGMVVKTFKIKTRNCANFSTPCDRIVLDGTSFTNNSAFFFGSSIVGTKPDNILVSCEARHTKTYGFMDTHTIGMLWNESILKALDFKKRCKSWDDYCFQNATCKVAIGTFGHTFKLATSSEDESEIVGNTSVGFTLKNVKSGKLLPEITITSIDAFGNANAPTLFERVTLHLNASNESAQPMTECQFLNGACTVAIRNDLIMRGNYTYQIHPRHDDILEIARLTILVQECVINEESTLEKRFCRSCGEASYNFNLSSSGKCAPCPENANCSTRYIKPNDGYWHKSPCHATMKECIIEEACEVEDRIKTLDEITQDLDNCNIDNSTLLKYENAQCHEGYEGPLCGSCQESYGLSSSFECLKCGQAIVSVIKIIGITCYLLFATLIVIKGVLPSNSIQNAHENFETHIVEANVPSFESTSSIQPMETFEEENNAQSLETTHRGPHISNATEHQMLETDIAKQKIIEAWKILLNFIQVTSTATAMDVDWTDEVLNTLEKLQIFGAATVNSISLPIECLLFTTSRATRVIWRILLGIFVPSAVIAILAMYWGCRSIMVHKGDYSYFLKRLLLTVITTTYITYFDLTQVAVRVFNCVMIYDDIDPSSNLSTRSWIADTYIECYAGAHLTLIGIAVVVLTLVSIGFPVFCSFALLANKDELHTTRSWAHETLSFLCGPFKTKFVYWECVTMIKKAMISIVIVFSYPLGNQAQGLLILLVLCLFLYLHLICYPYDEKFNSLNYYEAGSLVVSCATYTLVQFLNVETSSEFAKNVVSFSLFIITGAFVCTMLYKLAHNIIRLLRILLQGQNIQIGENASWFSIVKLYYKNRKVISVST